MKRALQLCASIDLLIAIWAIGWPHLWFDWSGMERPAYLDLWRIFGLALSVFAIGYLIASINPVRYWPIVVMGLIIHIMAPAGFVWACCRGQMLWEASWLLILADALWVPVFMIILWKIIKAHLVVLPEKHLTLEQASRRFQLANGQTLNEASQQQPLAIIFLRHFGCAFTQLLLNSLQDSEKVASAKGVKIVLVHMLEDRKAKDYLKKHGEVSRISDPKCELYQAFGLGKGDFLDIFGPKVWIVGIYALFKGCGVGKLAGDGLQMPGTFLYYQGEIKAQKIASDASDLPDPCEMLSNVDIKAEA